MAAGAAGAVRVPTTGAARGAAEVEAAAEAAAVASAEAVRSAEGSTEAGAEAAAAAEAAEAADALAAIASAAVASIGPPASWVESTAIGSGGETATTATWPFLLSASSTVAEATVVAVAI